MKKILEYFNKKYPVHESHGKHSIFLNNENNLILELRIINKNYDGFISIIIFEKENNIEEIEKSIYNFIQNQIS